MTLALPRFRSRRKLVVVAAGGSLALSLACAAPAAAHPESNNGCSGVDNLSGLYTGNITGTTPPFGQLTEQVQIRFDGNGHAFAAFTIVSDNLGTSNLTSDITYSLNSDCSGELVSTRSNGQTATYEIAVSKVEYGVARKVELQLLNLSVNGPGTRPPLVTGTFDRV
ncbi:hypothetical protein [Streptomyces sp. 1222.5]|uniref:hypothetical protein n=1 Tax=Streptomyces sp. 1222.5 TaxID=1881026 RepID=UPI003D74CFFA